MGSLDAYEVKKLIGHGSFGVVSRVERRSDGMQLVWKELNYGLMNEKEKELLVSEVNILRELRHPHIVRYYDRIIDRKATKIYIVMEYCDGGDLAQLIKKSQLSHTLVQEDFVWTVLAHTVLALNECHQRTSGKILHRDIKPGNIFLDRKSNAKLGDFGLARMMSTDSRFARTFVGTPFYMSPEQVRGEKYNQASDIWALGCVIYELCSLKPPFPASTQEQLNQLIKRGSFKRIPNEYSDGLQDLISQMLSIDPLRRPTVTKLLANRHIALRLRERKAEYTMQQAEKKLEECRRRSKELDEREKKLEAREQAILRENDGDAVVARPRAPSDVGRTGLPPRSHTEKENTAYHVSTRAQGKMAEPRGSRMPIQSHRPRYALRRFGSEPNL